MKIKSTAAFILSILVSACGGGGSSGPTNGSTDTAFKPDSPIQTACTNRFGQVWTEVDTKKQNIPDLENVLYGNGMFLGRTGNGTQVSSKDGENWVRLQTTHSGRDELTFALGKFISVEYSITGELQVSSSPDGVRWDTYDIRKNSANTVPLFTPQDIAFGNGRLVAVGGQGKGFGNGDVVIIWSTDIKTWSAAPNLRDLKIPESFVFNWVAFAKGKFYAATSFDPRLLYVSTDGNTWQTQKINGDSVFPSTTITGMQYINGLYVAVDSNGVIANSNDSINWKTVMRGTYSPIIWGNQLVASAGQVMTIDYQGAYSDVAYSCDGISWSKSKVVTGSFINKIAIGDNVAVKAGGRLSFSKY